LKNRANSFNNWINERFEYHRDLSPKFWKEGKMDPVIREKLLTIADDFWSSLKLEVPILDIQLTGSLANFNWNPGSDLDVHIIIDFAQVDENIELVRMAVDGNRFIWNLRHPVVLREHDVECYVQHKDAQHRASGLYSILKEKWLVVPQYNPPNIDWRDVNEKVRVIVNEVNEIKKRSKSVKGDEAKKLMEYLDRFKKKIMADRKFGLYDTAEGEFSVENLVFKELRSNGTFEEILDTTSDLYYRIYSE